MTFLALYFHVWLSRSCNSGVKQGESQSPTLYSISNNDLLHVQDIIELGLGVDMGKMKLSLLQKMKLSLLQCTLCGRHSNASETQSGPSTEVRQASPVVQTMESFMNTNRYNAFTLFKTT